jgi:hypothetical protein
MTTTTRLTLVALALLLAVLSVVTAVLLGGADAANAQPDLGGGFEWGDPGV